VGDFAWYDHVLQTIAHLGACRRGSATAREALTLSQYFASPAAMRTIPRWR
jgi:5-methyltetrahydropteroyltriglutamate--homocysteine methyltransferase